MRNSINVLSFVAFFLTKQCVFDLSGWGVCIFTKRVRIFSESFQEFNVFSLYISRLQCLQSLHFKTSMSSLFTFQDFNVFSVYISRLQCLQSLHFKTSMYSVFTFSRLQCFQSLHFKTSMSLVFYIPKDFNVSYFVVQNYNAFCLILLILPCRYPFVLLTGFTSLVLPIAGRIARSLE